MRPTVTFAILLLTAFASRAESPKVGDVVGKMKFTDTRSLPRTLDDFGKPKAVALVFVNTTCPVAKRYLPVLQAMETEYRAKGVQFVAVNAAEEDTVIDAATQAVKFDVEFPFVKDFGGACAKALGVTRTPQVVVLDAERRIAYRGRIDDQFRLGGVRNEPTTHELKDALDAVLAGKKVAVPETEVDGCAITFPKERKPRDVTFAEHVAPVLKKHCWECHKPGGSAPFALVTHKQAASKAAVIAEVVTDQRMPPWFAAHEFGPFVNARGLTDDERATLTDWAKLGAPTGDLSKAPAAPPEPKSKWLIGEPDLLIESQEFTLPATGDIAYQYAVLPHHFAEDTWVQGVQITTDNPQSLHHCNLAHASLKGGASADNFITGYVPGGEVMNLDGGIGFLIPKGSFLGVQIHFVVTGKPEKCRVKVGLRFPREAVRSRLRVVQLYDTRFAIPPGAPAHKVRATRTLDADAIGVGLFSHMHLRGKDMTFTAHAPGGAKETLLVIANYNFGWQIPYRWEPGKKRLPKGTRLECVARFDNSAFNPYNPDPKATVRNGPQTRDEMMYGFFFYTLADEKLNVVTDARTGVERKPVEPSVIEAYERSGARYGGWLEFGGTWYFREGKHEAEKFLPGFTFAELPEGKLPEVGVPFGLRLVKADDDALKRVAHLTNLAHLSFDSTEVTPTGVKALAPLKRLSSLEVWGKPLTPEHLKELSPLKRLAFVSLNQDEVTDDVLRALNVAGLLHLLPRALTQKGDRPTAEDAVREIDLSSAKVTPDGLKYLKPLRNLSRVYTPETTDRTLRVLREIGLLHTLEGARASGGECPVAEEDVVELYIYGQPVTDAGIKELAVLKNLSALKLQSTKVTEKGVAELRKALPRCKITAD